MKEESDGNAIQGLVIALPLSLLLWGLIAACIRWPLLGVTVGVAFAVPCFWLAWRDLVGSNA